MDMISHVKSSDCLTDHFVVNCFLDVDSTIKPNKKKVSYRSYGKIVENNMRYDLLKLQSN